MQPLLQLHCCLSACCGAVLADLCLRAKVIELKLTSQIYVGHTHLHFKRGVSLHSSMCLYVPACIQPASHVVCLRQCRSLSHCTNDICFTLFDRQLSCLLLQHMLYKYIEEDRNALMLLDPTSNKQNAQRILKVWEAFVMKLSETRRRLLCFCCTFKRASKLASEKAGSKHATQDELVWASTAAMPASIVRLIATRAYLASDVDNSVDAPPA